MDNQSNISKYYPENRLNQLTEQLAKRRPGFSKATIKSFYHAANQNKIHGKLSTEFQKFLGFLDQFIQIGPEKLEVPVLQEELEKTFSGAMNAQNTMWQIRFLNYAFDNEMRQKLHMIEEPAQKLNFAGVQRKITYDSQGQEWNMATHQSLGRGSRAFEQPFHLFNNFPDSVVVLERTDENYSSIDDRDRAQEVERLIKQNFNPKTVLKIPKIQLLTSVFENKSPEEIVTFMDKKPVSQFLSQLISNDTQDGRSLLELSHEIYTVEGMLVNEDESSSLLDYYLYRMNAYQDGPKISAYEDSDGNKLDFEFGFDPKNYNGKNGHKRLANEAFNFFKEEALERPNTFLDYIFHNKYQLDINLRTAYKSFKFQVDKLPSQENQASFNLSAIVDLGNQILSLCIGDGILMPIYHKDLASTLAEFEGLKDAHNLSKNEVKRIELGRKPNVKPNKKLPNYLAGVFDKNEVESFMIASRDLIQNRRTTKGQKDKKAYRQFMNNIVTPYITNDESTQRDKDQKFLADTLSFTNDSSALGLVFLSHKISDDSDSDINERIPDFDFDVDPSDSQPSNPWVDSPVDANTPFQLA